MSEPVSNMPELSVSELAGALKRTIEDAFGQVRLRGEITGYRGPHSSGHVYFSLKDQNAKIDAVIWKGVFSRIKFRPEDGLEVIATGRITTFPGKSSYQIVIEAMEPAGAGALMALLDERKRKLGAEGLFDPARKQLLPYLPRVIGVVTSPTGAVIRDILHRLSDRFPCHVLVWPVRVQGEESAGEVAAAIRGFNALSATDPLPRPDVLIIARGGGSLEDLWSFNEEIVIRAAAESDIPLISAIGHETDWTLLDLVADMRAPTPTAAAEMVVPVRGELLAGLRDRAARLSGSFQRGQERRKRDLSGLLRALPTIERLVEAPRQRLDLAVLKRDTAIKGQIDRRRLALSQGARRLAAQTPQARLARFSEQVRALAARLPYLATRGVSSRHERLATLNQRRERAFAARLVLEKRDVARRRSDLANLGARLGRLRGEHIARLRQKLAAFGQMLTSLNYKNVLARGYAIIRDDANAIMRNVDAARNATRLSIEFADGSMETVPDGARPRPKSSGGGKTGGGQGSLFE